MKSRCIVLLAAFCLVAGAASFATGDGKVLLYGGAGQGRVVFDGHVHAAKGFTCNDCHLQLFATRKQALITMDDHSSNRSCFACHNGEKAFNDCDKCHRSFDNAPAKVKQAALQNLNPAPAMAASHDELTYEGASTIGNIILPDATKLFTTKTGIKFGAIGGAGAKQGFLAARDGKVVFGGVARALTDEEKKQVPTSEVIGYDVMAVFVNGKNPVKNLTHDQLKGIFTGTVTNWRQLGGSDRTIVVYSERLNGGRATVEAFKTLALGGADYGPVKELDDATDCMKDVANDAGAITASSMAFLIPGVVPVSLDGVSSTKDMVRSGKYPLQRPLVLVSRQPNEGVVKQFLDFMLSPEGQEIVGRKFVPAR
jgi:phosphate transport system substrate-binding protein